MVKRMVFIAAALLAAGTMMHAQPGPGLGGGFGERRPPMERALGGRAGHGQWWNDTATAEKLKLTDEQRKGMDQILLAHREKLIDMRASLEKMELEMEPLMKADQPNEGQILAQIDKVAQARAELEKANARFLLALRAKLSPEQWKQLQADRAGHRDWRHEGPEGRRGPRGGGMAPGGGPGGGPQAAPPEGAGPEGRLVEPFPGDPGGEGAEVSGIETVG